MSRIILSTITSALLHRNFLFTCFLVAFQSFIVAACMEKQPLDSNSTINLERIETMPEVLPVSAGTLAPISRQIQTPIATLEPNIEPGKIDIANAARLVQQALMGKGTILAAPLGSPDGRWLAVPSSYGVYIYDARTWQELHRLPAAGAFIAFSPDSRLLAASGSDRISLWDPTSGDLVSQLEGKPGAIYLQVVFSADGSLLAATSWEREVVIWSLENGQPRFTLAGDVLNFSHDGQLAVVVTLGENKVHLYDTQSGEVANKWDFWQGGFTPGGLLWLSDQESVRLADLERDLMSAPFRGIQPAFSADGALMALYDQNQVSVYDHQAGRRTLLLEGNYVRLEKILFSPDGSTLAGDVWTLRCSTCSEMDGLDHYLVLWSAQDGSLLVQLPQPDSLGMLSYSADGEQLILADLEFFQVLEAADGSPIAFVEGFTAPLGGMALSPEGQTLAAAYNREPYTLRFWNLDDGMVEREWYGQPGGVTIDDVSVAYSPDGKYLAVGDDIWILEHGASTGNVLLVDTPCWANHVAFAPQDYTLATGCFDGQLDLWQIPKGTLVNSLGDYSGWVNEMAFSPSGENLAVIYNVPDYLVQVWQLPKGELLFAITGGHFTRVAYSPDGLILATILANQEYDQYGWPAGFVQLWEASSGEEIQQLAVEDSVSIAFSTDGQVLATGSLDGTLRLWEVSTGRLLLETSGHYQRVQRLVFTPDGTSLISGSLDGTIIRWGIPTRSPRD
jgi:WD40 repeat protein